MSESKSARLVTFTTDIIALSIELMGIWRNSGESPLPGPIQIINPEVYAMTLYKRTSPRVRNYDYSEQGPYSVTICLETRGNRFGAINSTGHLNLNDFGQMVHSAWDEIGDQFPDVLLDEYIVMPDHVHGIMTLGASADENTENLANVIGWFKTVTIKRYGIGVKRFGWPGYEKHLWHRSYYDHIVRNEKNLNPCRSYIEPNPNRWLENHGDS